MTIDLKKLREKYEELNKDNEGGGSGSDTVYVKLKDGNNTVRILPGKEGEDWYSETAIHRIPQEGQKWDKNVHCRRVHGEDCPICDAYYQLWDGINDGSSSDPDADRKLAGKIKARSRYYLNVLNREEGDSVQILSVGVKLFKSVVGIMMDEDFGDITDLENGNDLKVVKEMVEGFPNYDQSRPRPGKTPALESKKAVAEAMDSLHDIQGLVRLEDYNETKRIAEEIAIHGKISGKQESGGVSDDDYAAKLKS